MFLFITALNVDNIQHLFTSTLSEKSFVAVSDHTIKGLLIANISENVAGIKYIKIHQYLKSCNKNKTFLKTKFV